MLGDAQILRIPIIDQGPAHFWLLGAVLGTFVLGIILGAVARFAGMAERPSYVIPLVLPLLVLGFGLWRMSRPGGWVEVGERRITVLPRDGAPRTYEQAMNIELRAYGIRAGPGQRYVAGPLLEVEAREGRITLGARAPELAAGIADTVWIRIPPDVIVAPADFVRLASRLNVLPPAGTTW